MALQNADGVYLKVETLNLPNMVIYEKFKNKQIRVKQGDFDKVERGSAYSAELAAEMKVMADSTISIENNLITAGYKALKKIAEYKDWKNV